MPGIARFLVAAALALMVGAAPAFAVTQYASPTGVQPWGSATFANPTSLAAANAAATYGDSVLLKSSGTPYAQGIAPNAAGVRYVGNVAHPESVSVASVTPTNDARIRGITSRGSVTFPYVASRVVVEDFVAASLDMQDARDCRVSRAAIAGQIRLCRDVYPTPDYPAGKKAWAWRDTIEDVTCTAPLTTGWAMILGKATATYQAQELVDSAVVRRITFRPPAVSGTNFNSVIKLFVTNHSTFEDLNIAYTSSATDPGPDEGDLGVVIVRDSSSHNVFRRVTMDIHNPTGKEITGFATYVGVTDGGFQGDSYANTWEDCDIRILRARHTGVWYCNSSFDSLRLVGNVFATRGGGPALYFSLGVADASVATMAPTIVHNTLYNAAGPTFENRDATVHATGAQMSGNIFYRGDGSGCVRIEKNARFGDHTYFNDDSSLVYAVGGDRERYVGESGCAWKSQPTMHWVHPQFADTAWATLDLTPNPFGPAYSDSFPGGYAGAIGVDVCAQDLRPGRVQDLGVSAVTSSSISVSWTEPGSDQYANNDSQTLWDLRAAATPIVSESDWDAAAPVSILELDTPGLHVASGLTGLAVGVTRYFAVRYTDGDGLVGCLSASPGATTADNDPPSRVTDLAVTSTTGTSAVLHWTSPGDDGNVGTATSYRIRYRIGSPIVTEADWVASSIAAAALTPSPAGSFEEYTIGGLTSDRAYYFAVRAYDDVGNTGAISNSPLGVTPDVTAPGTITTLAAPSVGTTSVTLRWTSPGDDGAAGTASVYDVRYAPGSAITNEAQFSAATPVVGEPAPQVAGTIQSMTVSGLASGTTYAFAMKTRDEAGNWSALSNSVSRATIASDVTPPATSFITANVWRADGARVVFVAPGGDGSVGRAASYDVRFRTDPGVGLATWDDDGAQSVTMRVEGEGAPRPAGSPDTVFANGLRPGRTYWFAMTATDSAGNVSALSNVDSVAIPARPFAAIAQPAFGIYGGAGFAETEPIIRPWSVLVGNDGAVVDTANVQLCARYPIVTLEPAFADSGGPFGKLISLAAIQLGRSINPATRWLAEPTPDASYVRVCNSCTPGSPQDTANFYAYRFQQWRAARDAGGGWTAGGGFLFDYISPSCFHQTRASGCVPGNTLLNTNHAYRQPGTGRFLVCDSLVAVYRRQFIERRNPDGSWVWDGVMLDLNNPDIFSEINLNWSRAGFADSLSMDSTWVEAKAYFMKELRAAAVAAGRPDFIISGNGVSGRAYDHANGWMREGWPSQQGGTWSSNWLWTPGGQLADAYGFSAWAPAVSWLFAFTCATSDSCAGFNPDSAGARKDQRYAQGTATLTGHVAVYEPSKAALAQGGGWHRYWWDEWAVDTLTGQASIDPAKVGWMGRPRGAVRNTAPPIWAGGDRLQGVGGFEAGTLGSAWVYTFSGPTGQVTAGLVSDTVATGSFAFQVNVGTRQVADWTSELRGGVNGYATSGQVVVLSFKARASVARPVQAMLVQKNSPYAPRDSWSALSRSWISDSGWVQYRLVGTATATDSLTACFRFGDAAGTVQIDDVTLHVGGARGGSFLREYERGVVVVNPQSYADTVTLGYAVRRITTQVGKNPDVNNGALVLGGSSIIVPARDARFLLVARDSVRPRPISDLLANTPTSSSCRVSWTAPGDDSLEGTPASVFLRRASTPIASEAQWAAATPIPVALVAGGTAFSATVTGLSPSTVYYFAARAADEAGYLATISNSDSVTTLAQGAAPDAAFGLSAYAGAEPLTVAATDKSTNSPTAWEWYVRRTTPAGEADPQISADQNPTFALAMGGTYTISLQTSNDYGHDTTSAEVVVACTSPAPIASMIASAQTATSILVSYVETGDDGNVGTAGSFELRYRQGDEFKEADWSTASVATGVPAPTGPGSLHAVEVAGLAAGTQYAFAMKSTDSGGCVSAIGVAAVASTVGTLGRSVGVSFGDRPVRVTIGGR